MTLRSEPGGGAASVAPIGRHLLVEYHGCDPGMLDDRVGLLSLLRQAAAAAGSTVVAEVLRPFSPQGVTGVLVIEESHLSVHTWPERGYAAVDFYTCGRGLPERAVDVLRAGLSACRAEVMVIERGRGEPGRGLVLVEHQSSGDADS